MRKLGQVFFCVCLFLTGAQAQELRDTKCIAPVELDDADCADVASSAPPPEYKLEQRDDGYFVLVPQVKD